DFDNLYHWNPLYFPKIKVHTSYSIESYGEHRCLKAESNNSASALVYKHKFNVYEFPLVKWRWKVENVYARGDAKNKEGDDYPLRVYIIFDYNPENAGFFEKLTYNSAKLLYGQYPPASSLNYIWSNREHTEKVLPNSYTKKAQMFLLQSGESNVGKWIIENINIVRDYHVAFGKPPPDIARMAIMNDSDNTGETSVSYLDYIEIYRKGERDE
ncbi:MAG: DUF3047 domain-containing protein, partial [Thermodesulfobacteriota bacterium]|nr:DUF3047 domain-containing protein [Thermodesulfobacteriota bacterium]